MYRDILFINKHIVWRSIYVPYILQRLQWTCDKSVVFSETPVSSTNKTEIFLKVAVNTIQLKQG
jgi:hypothetical protein